MKHSMRPADEMANNSTPDSISKGPELHRDVYPSDDNDAASEISEKQAGVKRIEAMSKTWTKSSLIIAYAT
jgi:SP family sugar:H+ symporter-like MFS transporter